MWGIGGMIPRRGGFCSEIRLALRVDWIFMRTLVTVRPIVSILMGFKLLITHTRGMLRFQPHPEIAKKLLNGQLEDVPLFSDWLIGQLLLQSLAA
jgi:hypothetical protein